MDIGAASFARLAKPAPGWRSGMRDRRSTDRRAREAHYQVADEPDPAPGPAPGPAIDFMAHIAGQGGRENDRRRGFAIYAALRAPRLACGVCADERA